jgi:SAM-dependent methyltransferase
LSPKKSIYWNEVIEELDEKRKYHPSLWRVHSDDINKALVARWLPVVQYGRLLKTDLFDEAVSNGIYPLLTSCSRFILGMDISEQILRTAHSHHTNLQAVLSDVRSLPFGEGSFDFILSNSTLDHFINHREISKSLHELHRVLRPEGRLLLTLDNPVNPLITLRQLLPFRLLKRIGVLPYFVGVTYNPVRLRRALEEAGFRLLEMTAVMHFPRVLVVALARSIKRFDSPVLQRRLLRFLMTFERLERWPTRFLTGHFLAVLAIKH